MRSEPTGLPLGRVSIGGPSELLGSITHLSDDGRYSWLNQAVGVLTGQVRPIAPDQFDVVLEVAELVWQPVAGE